MGHEPHHHDSSGSGFIGGLMGSMMGMIIVILIGLVLVIAVFAWQPWAGGGTTMDPVSVPGNGNGNDNGGNGNGDNTSWHYQQPGFSLIA